MTLLTSNDLTMILDIVSVSHMPTRTCFLLRSDLCHDLEGEQCFLCFCVEILEKVLCSMSLDMLRRCTQCQGC